MSDPEEVSRRSFAAAAASAALGTLSLSDELSAQELSGDTLKSEFLFDVVFDVSTPFNLGSRQIVPVTGGTFAGPKLKGTAFSGGGDWIVRRSDGASVLNVRATLKTDDDQLIYMSYDGILYTPAGAKPGEFYWRTTPKFETASPKYEWLTRIVAVGVGRPVPGKAAYRIFQIL
ncbi:MAG: DUF3237 domain-containing protein [Acidobacteria bacterium]|nr:MAG: DUF3237 domain-containing protein [Acidobacteriota bacterium]PYR48791.1 MAG: DUF3237 domain-containing protein [Acidobacteriota bacterium]